MTRYCMSEKVRSGREGCHYWKWGQCTANFKCNSARVMTPAEYKQVCELERG